MKRALLYFCCFLWLTAMIATRATAQPGSSVSLSKPEKYENRILGSEKTGNRKFTATRHIYQNMVTHYNYYFNANNKINAILERAKQGFKDDFTQLLPFYNFSLDATAQEKNELDSIIYKCTAGILLHDLRSDWVDNMYLLLGRAYFYRKDFDSATNVFRYMNYAFAPKDDGYDIPIGSNVSGTDSVFTISTNEHRNLYKKATTHLPSRNDALLWLAHTYTERKQVDRATGLLEILKSDPAFPQRLQSQLHEEIAYWYYVQQVYDSAAVHLAFTLRHAENMQDRSRREYLIAQLYQLTGDNQKASQYFMQSASHTLNPIQEAYATLSGIRVMSKTEKAFLQQKQRTLLQLAKKEKYRLYRDVIYYAAAQVTLEMQDTAQAEKWLLKSVASSVDNPAQRSSSFLLLGDLNYDTKNYVAAHNFYDSLDASQLAKAADKERVEQRKPFLNDIAGNATTIHTEDSLRTLAAMPAAERLAFMKKELKRLRKLQGLKEDESGGNTSNPAIPVTMPAEDLFVTSGGNSSEWYFNNTSLKASGIAQFNATWGKRPNADNWRRSAAVDRIAQNTVVQDVIDSTAAGGKTSTGTTDTLSVEAMLNKLPTTPEKVAASDTKIMKALLENGKIFQNQLQDYPSAIEAYTELLRRYPASPLKEEAMLNLYYCYRRTSNRRGEDSVQNALRQSFPNGKFTQMLDRHISPEKEKSDLITKRYEHVYDLFISGNFEEAKKEKSAADTAFGTTNWSPQLLYIEAVYYIRQREDSVAIQRLTDLKKDSASPLAEKAATMIDVLKRRKEIESYLTKLQVTRDEDDGIPITMDESQLSAINTSKMMDRDSIAAAIAGMRPISIRLDTIAAITVKDFSYNPEDSQYVMIILNKVDPVYVNEAKNAFLRYNRDNYRGEQIDTLTARIDETYNLLLMGPFPKSYFALDYVSKARASARSRILPWLTPEKYEFAIISRKNLAKLQEIKDMAAYRELLKLALPDKF